MRLEGKVAIVTGGATGIGKSIATQMAEEGASVIIDYVGDAAGADAAVTEITASGGKAAAIAANVADPGDIAALINGAVQRFGRLDIMVNNAGIEEKHPFVETPLELWNKVIAVNLTGPWLGAQTAARQMIAQGGGGRIINISSVHEDLPMPTNAPYCAAKGGLRMLARTVAIELAAHGITVNNIGPGAIDTPMDAPLKAHPEQMQALLDEIPLRRMGRPDEVAGMAVYLASDEGAYVTGTTLFIDGGLMHNSGSL